MIHPKLLQIILELNETVSQNCYEEIRRKEEAKRRKQKQKELRRAQKKQTVASNPNKYRQ